MIIQDLGKSIEEYKAKLVMVDSIIALHRAEFTGRGTLAERQQRLNIMLHKLSRLAEVHNIGIISSIIVLIFHTCHTRELEAREG
jgi:DNA repair protein RadA